MPEGGLLLLRGRLAQVLVSDWDGKGLDSCLVIATVQIERAHLTGRYTPLSLISKATVSARPYTAHLTSALADVRGSSYHSVCTQLYP